MRLITFEVLYAITCQQPLLKAGRSENTTIRQIRAMAFPRSLFPALHSTTILSTRHFRTIHSMRESNRLGTALREGRQSLGMWQMVPGANISRLLARSGVDWVLVDCEHGNMDDGAMHDAVPAIAALGVSPVVRIPDMQSWMVKRALDAGAHGILVPLLRSAEQAREVVQAAKFPPTGRRGFGSPFSPERFSPMPSFSDYLQQANDALLTMVQIETREALEAVEEIAAVDGIDLLFIGPFDLGNNIGHPIIQGVVAPELKEAMARILAACHKCGKKCGIYSTDGEQARQFREQGFDMISVATDYTALEFVLQQQLCAARGEERPSKKGSY
ncbi:hypothetical protein CDD80_3283 [Ophiocordyceps camponoti-rufipedis]|uniref:HpcH/HpaI aldolase/citrate lyase domain-containing protein n=1 Tax=Ophiocordyceps camponoti-rufipedis TaxID=2004952 RepID=A0A2C5Y7W0_9HYPO|nr:hypothetical protein CDD80_3283 [Ophiocordyceps camponoti-rufipedis]